MLEKIKFEYVFAILVVVILAVALFIFRSDKDTVSMIMTALVGALSAITAFFFTKTQVRAENRYANIIPEKTIEPEGEITEQR